MVRKEYFFKPLQAFVFLIFSIVSIRISKFFGYFLHGKVVDIKIFNKRFTRFSQRGKGSMHEIEILLLLFKGLFCILYATKDAISSILTGVSFLAASFFSQSLRAIE